MHHGLSLNERASRSASDKLRAPIRTYCCFYDYYYHYYYCYYDYSPLTANEARLAGWFCERVGSSAAIEFIELN